MKLFLFILLLPAILFAQQAEFITVTGDSLSGHISAGESIREVYGHVVLTQGNVVITCDKAIQFLSRNDAELIGNVVVKQDSITITTPRGFYYGDERRAESSSGVKLDDQKVILSANNGEYFFNEDRAFFWQNVSLYDTTTTLTSDSLTYFQKENKTVAVSNVKIVDQENIIRADSLQHTRDTRITIADNNVKITSLTNNVEIYGGHLEDYANDFYTLVNENPVLIQVDTTYHDSIAYDTSGAALDSIRYSTLDTLIIKSNLMEAYRDTINRFEAKDSVKILRGVFSSKNDYTIYNRISQQIITYKVSAEAAQPVLWYETSQLTGDSVTIHLIENSIQLLELDNSTFIVSQNELFNNRYDQISGEHIKMNFDSSGISSMEVQQNVYSIYYIYEENEPNGLMKATSQSALIELSGDNVSAVKFYESAKSEYYPENMIAGNEFTYTLPGFRVITGRPVKEDLLGGSIPVDSETFLLQQGNKIK